MKKLAISIIIVFFVASIENLLAKQVVEHKDVLLEEVVLPYEQGKTMHIDNERGNIVVKSWDRNEVAVKVDVFIKAKNNKEIEKIQKKISIDADMKNWKFRTRIGLKQNSKKHTCEIHFTVFAPKGIKLKLATHFGNVYLQSISNASEIKTSFTQLEIAETDGIDEPLHIDVAFASRVVLGTVGNLNLTAKYAKVYINKALDVRTNTEFSIINIDESVRKMDIRSTYDTWYIRNVESITADNMPFVTLKVHFLEKFITIDNFQYGELRLENFAQNFSHIDIKSSFSGIHIFPSEQNVFHFDLKNKFGQNRLPKEAKLLFNSSEDSYQQQQGTVGNPNEKQRISIQNKFANTRIK